MISPSALDAARPDDLKRESAIVPVEPKRRRWVLPVVAIFLVVVGFAGCNRVLAWGTRRLSGSPPEAASKVSVVGERVVGGVMGRPERGLKGCRVVYVCGGKAGLEIDGTEYELGPGDECLGVVVGLVGVRCVDVQIGGDNRRLYLARAVGGDERSGPSRGSVGGNGTGRATSILAKNPSPGGAGR